MHPPANDPGRLGPGVGGRPKDYARGRGPPGRRPTHDRAPRQAHKARLLGRRVPTGVRVADDLASLRGSAPGAFFLIRPGSREGPGGVVELEVFGRLAVAEPPDVRQRRLDLLAGRRVP